MLFGEQIYKRFTHKPTNLETKAIIESMEELAKLFNNDINYAGTVVESFRNGMSLIMKSNCYQLTPVEYEGFNFSIPSNSDFRIFVKCDYELQLTSIDIWAIAKNLQVGHTFSLQLSPESQKVVVAVDKHQMEDYSWFNPQPVIRHCRQLIEDLDLPISKLGMIRASQMKGQ